MSYTFTGQGVQKLYGQTFSIKNIASNADEIIEIQLKEVFRARRGTEGYGLRAIHRHRKLGNLHAFLKVFGKDIPQRRQRSEFLVKQGLAKRHEWVFQGVPYAWFNRRNVNGAEIVGHLTKFIGLQYGEPAEDFSVLKENGQWDGYLPLERRSFAAHLASAIYALERLDLVHGDLSGGNLMIGSGPEGRHICCLCDFDGFYHPSQEKLPRKFEGELTRPLGSSGYRYPELIKRARADKDDDDENLFVEADRFALAVLICEMMVWNTDLGKKLARAELLDEDVITSRKLSDIPDRTKGSFSQGFELLEKALHAGSCQDMPTPDDWLRCLGVRLVASIPFKTAPGVLFYRRESSVRKLYQHRVLNTKTAGSFGEVHSDLGAITFKRDDANQVVLAIASLLPCALCRSGRQQTLAEEEKKSVAIVPGDRLRIDDWEIHFEESLASA